MPRAKYLLIDHQILSLYVSSKCEVIKDSVTGKPLARHVLKIKERNEAKQIIKTSQKKKNIFLAAV
jgi:hypothetical protein